MPEFKDAKVLRSDEVTLTQEELRILYSTLEVGDNDIKDLRKLSSIGDKIEAALGNYYSQIDAAMTDARNKVRQGTEAGLVDAALNLIVAQIDFEQGQELSADVLLTMAEWQWIKDRWSRNNKFVGSKTIRDKLLRIDDAISNAKGVAYKNKVAWVQGEPEPTPIGDNSSNGHTRSYDGAGTQEVESAV